MVSKLYSADTFYAKQKNKKIATGLVDSKKLMKDKSGFYLNKKTPVGKSFKQRVSNSDKVYARDEGVTKYSEKADKKKRDSNFVKETPKKHNPNAHTSDRSTKGGKQIYI